MRTKINKSMFHSQGINQVLF